MPLHVEQVAEYIKGYAQVNYALALSNLYSEHDAQLSLTAPNTQSYFLGEPNRYTPLDPPALFINPIRTRRFDTGSRHSFNVALYQEHVIELIVLVEDVGEEELSRVCMRHAQALDALLNEFELEPDAISQHKAIAHVTDVDYGTTYTRTRDSQRMFAKDVTLAVLVQHWDQYTQLPLQTGGGAQITTAVGTVIPGSVVSTVSDTLLTAPTTDVVTYTTPGAGNYGIYIYLRCTSATTLTITVSWTDGSGAQSSTVLDGTQSVGSFMVSPAYVNATAGSTITITATVGVVDVVTVSATVEALS